MANGIEVRGDKIRVYFTYEGEKCREPVPGKATPEAIAYAERLVGMINHEIAAGTFDYARHFPNSKRLKESTLAHYIDLYLKTKESDVAPATLRGYKSHINNHVRPKFGKRQANSIDYLDVKTWISEELSHLSSKSIKEIVALMRAIYKLIATRHPEWVDPTAQITVKQSDDDEPDPFTRDEINLITRTPAFNGKTAEKNMAIFMLWSGPRPSEVPALAWEDVIDLDEGIIKIQRALVRGDYKATKTKGATREVKLLRPAREALQAQFTITGRLPPTKVDVLQRDNRTKRPQALRFVFLKYDGEPMTSDRYFREWFFQKHLEQAEVRYRGPGQCRHTFISQMLTAGLDVNWIAKVTGTSVEMIHKRYGKWIEDDAPDMVSIAEDRLKL